MSYKWRILCTVHGWVYGWADTPITICPIEASDLVDLSTTVQVGREIETFVLTPTVFQIKNSNYNRVSSVVYNSDINGTLSRVKVMSYMDSGLTSYNVEVYDRTNNVSLVNATFTNTGDISEQNVGLIATPPDGKVTIEINVKCTGASNKYANISQIIFYTRKENE